MPRQSISATALLILAGISQAAAAPLSARDSIAVGDTSSTTTTTAAAAPGRLLNDAYWTYRACYDDSAVGERTVKNLIPRGQGLWSIESCLAAAKEADYSVAGIIYGGEWGSDTIPDKDLTRPSSSCEWRCNDNHDEFCGGQSSVDVYYTRSTSKLIDDELWSYQGCYSDANDRRTLANLVTAEGPQAWTIEKCLAAVNLAGYTYGAVEYGGECWGANSVRGDANKLSTATCNMRCNDAADSTCGGVNALDVYKLRRIPSSAVLSVVAPSTVSSVAAAASTAASSSTVEAPTSSVVPTSTSDAVAASSTSPVQAVVVDTCPSSQAGGTCAGPPDWMATASSDETCCPIGQHCALGQGWMGMESVWSYCDWNR